jgi:hypothetical protein
MPAIKRLLKACKASFSPNGPVSEEALEQVRTLLGENNKEKLLIYFQGLSTIAILVAVSTHLPWMRL